MITIKKSPPRFALALVGMFVMALIASRELYLFVVMRNQPGLLYPDGASLHLWLAGGATVLACIAGGSMFLFFIGRGNSGLSNVLLSSPALARVLINPGLSAARWAQLNEWSLDGQADDRKPMNGSVAKGVGSASAQRADARQAHQVMFKEWAGQRRE